MYLPLYDIKDAKVLFKIPFAQLAKFTVSLPLFGFLFCVVVSILKDFDAANFTHCHVFNVFPSVSAAIGNFYPQNFIWKLTVTVHAPLRLLVVVMYFSYYLHVLSSKVHFLAVFACLLNAIENISLVCLSYWTSSENYPVHKASFITFIATSEVYMLLTCFLLTRYRRLPPLEKESVSIGLKRKLLAVNICSFAIAGYFFVRHNTHCEPLVYSMFALMEYIVILTNMGFHMTAALDFTGKEIVFKPSGVSFT